MSNRFKTVENVPRLLLLAGCFKNNDVTCIMYMMMGFFCVEFARGCSKFAYLSASHCFNRGTTSLS